MNKRKNAFVKDNTFLLQLSKPSRELNGEKNGE
jgi:hypothetical protein